MTILLLFLTLILASSGGQSQTQPARLSGRIVAADTGAPVRAAAIRMIGTGSQITLVATADDEGRFELPDVAAGKYLLQVSKAGFVTSTFGLSGRTSDLFGVSAGQQINLRDLQLPRAGVVSGRVVDLFGDPIADVSVTAWRVEHLTPARRRVVTRKSFQTDDRGEFRVYGLQPGKYLVSASRIAVALVDAPGGSTPALTNTGQREAPTFYPGTGNAFEAVPVEVRPGEDAAGIHIQLLATQYGAVSGVVTNSKGAPYDTAFVWLWPARADNVEFSTMQLTSPTDSQGRFRIVDVSPGDYRMEVLSRAGLEKLGQSGSMADLLGGEVASVPVTVLSGRTQEMSVRASPGFRVRGRVFVDGAPIVADLATKLTVMVQPTSSGISGMAIPVPAPLSSDGSFVASGILGNRSFSVNGSPSLYFYRTLYQSQDVSESGVDVAADTTGIEVHLTTRPSKLEGSARDGSGAVVPSGRVIVFSPDRSEWMRPATRRYRALPIRSDGTFNATGLPAGSYLAALVSLDQDRYADPDFIESLRPFATQFTISDGTTTTIELRTKK